MARILLTSGPTRQYLDPVRYITNSSSGKMGAAIAQAAIAQGHEVWIASGPVEISYPPEAKVFPVVTTDDLLEVCSRLFPDCDGLIGVAAPCDYKPKHVAEQKIAKTGKPLMLELWECPDVVATMGAQKRADQWVVGFALETEDPRFRALVKLQKKSCDLIVSNGPAAMNSDSNDIEILDRNGEIVTSASGPKTSVAEVIMNAIRDRLIAE